MTQDNWTDRLSEYLDGTLAVGERAALEAHLVDCAACAATLEELRRVVARARALDDRAPGADLWPKIAVGIGRATVPRARRYFAFTVPQLIAASVALIILSGGATWLLRSRAVTATPVAIAPPQAHWLGAAAGRAQTAPRFRGGPGARLDVNNFGGSITVSTWAKSAVRVQAEHSSRDRVQVSGSEAVVSVKSTGRLGPSQVIDYTITVPVSMALALSGVYTDITVEGSQGEITAETVQGEVKVTGGSGFVSLRSVNGEVTLEKARGSSSSPSTATSSCAAQGGSRRNDHEPRTRAAEPRHGLRNPRSRAGRLPLEGKDRGRQGDRDQGRERRRAGGRREWQRDRGHGYEARQAQRSRRGDDRGGGARRRRDDLRRVPERRPPGERAPARRGRAHEHARGRRGGRVHGARAGGRQVRRQDRERGSGSGESRRRRGGLHGERRHPHLDVGLRGGDDRERVDRGGGGEGGMDGRR